MVLHRAVYFLGTSTLHVAVYFLGSSTLSLLVEESILIVNISAMAGPLCACSLACELFMQESSTY